MERKLKLTLFLMVTCCTSVRSSEQKTKEELLETAAAQLERLAPFRKINQVPENSSENLQDFFRYYANKTNQEVTRTNEKFDELRLPLQLLQMLTDTKLKGSESEIAKRGDTHKSTSNFLQEASYDPTMQERTKRSGSNSGSFVSGIATKVIGGVFSASSGASRGSSSSSDPQPHSYGPTAYLPPVYTYEQQSFDVWSFKKAIFNTLIQAIKAIGGGVLALKGQLIKGGGFLVSTKGRIISSTGEAISSLGRNIASSTYVVAPKPVYSHSGYAYNPPPSHPSGYSGQDIYPGPPPSANGYTTTGFGESYQGSNGFGAASDDDVEAGLLIMTPNDSGDHHHEHQQQDLDPRHPNILSLEDSFGIPPKESNMADIHNSEDGGPSSNAQSFHHDLETLQLPTDQQHVPFNSHSHQNFFTKNNNNLEHQELQKEGFHPDIPKIAPLPISESNPSNSLNIVYPPNTITQNSDHKPQIVSQPNSFQSTMIQSDLMNLPTFEELKSQNQLNYGSQINDFKDHFITGIPIEFTQQEPLKIPILNQLPKEHRKTNVQQIENRLFRLAPFKSFNSKQFGDFMFGRSLRVQPPIGYTI